MVTNYDTLTQKCKNIIKNNDPEKCIDKISNMRSPGDGKKLGTDIALKIYNAYSSESVSYDSNKYKNNINDYKKDVNANINKANKYTIG